MYEFRDRMEREYGFEFIDAASGGIPYGSSMFFNLTTGFMFYCNLGVNNLSGPYIADMSVTMEEFIQIVEIYRKHTKNGRFIFKGKRPDEDPDSIGPETGKMDFGEYKKGIGECLMLKLDEKQTEQLMKLYEDDLEDFYKKKWTPGTAAMAMIIGY
ncbi:MAG: hypothetical protein K5648_00185 [Erysipelotrichaceae bacterium]|nr:hypothetical protein [Erysipelotrichaceae bacterium]